MQRFSNKHGFELSIVSRYQRLTYRGGMLGEPDNIKEDILNNLQFFCPNELQHFPFHPLLNDRYKNSKLSN